MSPNLHGHISKLSKRMEYLLHKWWDVVYWSQYYLLPYHRASFIPMQGGNCLFGFALPLFWVHGVSRGWYPKIQGWPSLKSNNAPILLWMAVSSGVGIWSNLMNSERTSYPTYPFDIDLKNMMQEHCSYLVIKWDYKWNHYAILGTVERKLVLRIQCEIGMQPTLKGQLSPDFLLV